MELTFSPIGIIHSCFKEKFGIPRQAGIIDDITAELELYPPYNQINALDGLENFSHIWVVFIFHKNLGKEWKPMVRPPRLGGNKKLGVFATRSGFRPNPIGLSAVKLKSITRTDGKTILILNGVDFMDKTPVLDIKPYIPYADMIQNAVPGFAADAPTGKLNVIFSPRARLFCRENQKKGLPPDMERFITKILEIDPRPAYCATSPNPKKQFGMRLFDIDVKWEVKGNNIVVTSIETVR